MTTHIGSPHAWPRLRVDDWTATRDTLHMSTQILGKIRLSQTPLLNHWWQVSLYVSPRGLTAGAISGREAPEHPGGAPNCGDGQFLLPYEAVAETDDPDRTLAQFLHTTYQAAADLGASHRSSLEDDPVRWPQHRPGQKD